MSRLSICLIAACATDEPRFGEQQQADTVVNKFKGTEANGNSHTDTTSVSIDLFQNISNTSPTETFLFYSYSIADPTSQVCTDVCVYARWTTETGMGDIANNAAQINGNRAQVMTSTNIAGFTVTRCVSDTRDGSNVCTAGTQGTVSIQWRKDGVNEEKVDGRSRTKSPGTIVLTQGTFVTNSSVATGSLPGSFTFSNSGGSLIDSRNSFITKTFTRN
jgi:hypothetical protein